MKKYFLFSIACALAILLNAGEGIAGKGGGSYCKSLCESNNRASTACQVEPLYKICIKCPDVKDTCEQAFEKKEAPGSAAAKSIIRKHCNPDNCKTPEVQKACKDAYQPLIEKETSKSGKEYEKKMLEDNCTASDKAKPKTDQQKKIEADAGAKAKQTVADMESKAKGKQGGQAAGDVKALEAYLKKDCTPKKCEDTDVRASCFKKVDAYTETIEDKKKKESEDERLKQKCLPGY